MRLTKKTSILIGFFGLLKLLLHFLTNTNYGLHRDEFLYFDEGKHLAFGFYEVPPITPFIGKLAALLGGNVFAIRLFPALAGTLIVVLACKLVKDLGGGIWAIFITGFTLTLSPSLLGSNALFQPVSFNQMFWFLLAYSIVQLIRTEQKKYYYLTGLFIGLGILTKYSILFYILGLLLGILISPQRILLKSKHFLTMVFIAFLLVLPNFFWQIQHSFPVLDHMRELSETQLAHVNWQHFLSAQIIEYKGFTLVWLMGLLALLFFKKIQKYRSLGLAFILLILLVGFLQGKAYYTLGAFLILVPFGALFFEHYISKTWLKTLLCLLMFLFTVPFYPLSLPLLKVDALKKYTHYLSENFGINYMLRWEDGEFYDLSQDVADMFGWEELADKVAQLYHSIPENEKAQCMIYGGSYGHAGSLNYYREQYDLPEIYSLNGSYVFWADTSLVIDKQIMVDDRKQSTSQWFSQITLVDSIQHPHAREKGYIYFRTKPKLEVGVEWRNLVREIRD